MERDHLERAKAELDQAHDATTGEVQEHLASIRLGIFNEESGDQGASDAGPKVDRISEVFEKLGGLADEVDESDAAGDEADADDVASHLEAARDELRKYMREHPQGG